MKQQVLFLICAICVICGCQKEELPVPKHDAGNVTTSTVNMSNDYRNQVFFDLETNTAVSQNLKTAWDLGFETSEDGYRVILNSAKAMYAYKTSSADFNSVSDTSGFGVGKKMEPPTGNMDSTAIGDWQSSPNVYIVDRGYNEAGSHQGFRKIIFQGRGCSRHGYCTFVVELPILPAVVLNSVNVIRPGMKRVEAALILHVLQNEQTRCHTQR